MKKHKNKFNIFIGAFIKAILATCCAYFVANKKYMLATITSAGIGWIWATNVSNIVVTDKIGRGCYIVGFTTGVGVSLFILKEIFGI